jgi:RimJ/RimL family protein N-acetyltransferase
VAVPVLATPRLVLRAHAPADFAALAAMWADPGVVRHIGGEPSTADASWARLLRYAGLWPLLGFGYWAVERRADGAYLGDAGLADWHRAMAPPLDGLPEAGWVLRADAHGHGYATEAMAAVLAWADRNLPAAGTACIVDPGHAASLRVAAKLGYRETARSAFRGETVVQLRRAAPP